MTVKILQVGPYENRHWEPARCPIARDQPFGYKHFHSEACLHASPEQIAADRDELARRTLRARIRRLLRLLRR